LKWSDFAKEKNVIITKIWSDNSADETYDTYPVDEVFCAESTILTTINWCDVEQVDSNLSVLNR
jgi:hypothetical protein